MCAITTEHRVRPIANPEQAPSRSCIGTDPYQRSPRSRSPGCCSARAERSSHRCHDKRCSVSSLAPATMTTSTHSQPLAQQASTAAAPVASDGGPAHIWTSPREGLAPAARRERAAEITDAAVSLANSVRLTARGSSGEAARCGATPPRTDPPGADQCRRGPERVGRADRDLPIALGRMASAAFLILYAFREPRGV
jgi:hypothetical protein